MFPETNTSHTCEDRAGKIFLLARECNKSITFCRFLLAFDLLHQTETTSWRPDPKIPIVWYSCIKNQNPPPQKKKTKDVLPNSSQTALEVMRRQLHRPQVSDPEDEVDVDVNVDGDDDDDDDGDADDQACTAEDQTLFFSRSGSGIQTGLCFWKLHFWHLTRVIKPDKHMCEGAKAAGLVGYTWHISACPFLFRHLWRKAAPRKAHDDTMAPVRWHQVSECAQHRAATETTQPAQAPHPRLKN